MEELFIQYAPILIIVVVFLTQNHFMVKPEELEKKHREILNDIEKKFVTWSAFKALQDSVNDMKDKVDKIFEHIIKENE